MSFHRKLIPQSFYNRPTLVVARELLGARLVRLDNGMRLVGIICETEAYIGEEDEGCHAHAGRTRRNASMYGPPGHAYVYFTYGMHWMLNAVTEEKDFPAAVLIRAILPVEGLEVMLSRRQGRDTFGPAKLTQAMGIDRRLDGTGLFNKGAGLWIEEGNGYEDAAILLGSRVGLNGVPEPWKSKPWRFRVQAGTDLLNMEG
jgi:DNA-3-methyladenine glycosylase